jgi:hypothetical protein
MIDDRTRSDSEEPTIMLVRFSSTKTESITMFGDVAAELIAGLGAGRTIPGAIRAEDIPAALARLRADLQARAGHAPEDAANASRQGEDQAPEPQVPLATRALPLIGLLQRAAAGNVPVMWESG